MTYQETGSQIPDCGTINFKPNINVRILFKVNLQKNITENGNGWLRISIKRNSFISETPIETLGIFTVNWTDDTQSGTSTYEESYDITLNGLSFDNSEGILYAEFTNSVNEAYKSCEYDVIKSPTFTLNHQTLPISCSNTNSVTFIVSNVYSHLGTLSYNWSVGSGWLYNGSTAPNSITTTSNSLVLTPNANPPGNISVTPILDGVNYPALTSTVSLAAFNPNYVITGSNSICTSNTYSVSVPSGESITSWSTSNINIATITANGNQATVTKSLSSGFITISAIVTNSCGQTATLTKNNVFVGRPLISEKIFGPTTVGQGEVANYSVDPIPGASSYGWRLPYPYQIVTNFDYFGQSWQLLNATMNSSAISSVTGYSGTSGFVQVWGENNCGTGSAKKIYVTHTGSGSGGGQFPIAAPIEDILLKDSFSIYPNPAKNSLTITKLTKLEGNTAIIKLFDIRGKLIQNTTFDTNKINFNTDHLKNGTYLLIITSKDKAITRKIIVNH